MNRKKLLYGFVFVAAVIGWAAFRPERLFVNAKVNESMPAATGTSMAEKTLASGTFHSVAHTSAGNANVYQLPDGKRILRFTHFTTSNGPDVRVYLTTANDATDNETVTKAGFVEIAPLKGNIGDQNYELSPDVDLTKYHAVTIWCKRFSVNFATAPLNPTGPMAANK
jgi:hypothetical protein